MTTTAKPQVVHAPAGSSEAVWAMGSLFELLLPTDAVQGELTVMRVHQPPGIATPLHRHTNESELFFLLAGEMDYEADGELYRLGAGDLIWLPQGLPHRFRIRGDEPADILALAAPGGLDDMYRSVGVPAAERRIPDEYPAEPELARWRVAGAEHGLEVLGPPLPERGLDIVTRVPDQPTTQPPTGPSATVTVAAPQDRDRVIDTVVAAFAADPAFRFFFPDDPTYAAHAAAFAGWLFDRRVGHGTVWVADGGASVAMWEPPRGGPTSEPTLPLPAAVLGRLQEYEDAVHTRLPAHP